MAHKSNNIEKTFHYATLLEIDTKDIENYIYLIRYEGNEVELIYLEEIINSIKWDVDVDNIFELDIKNLITEETAQELMKLNLRSIEYRKFNGTLKHITFKLKDDYKAKKKQRKVCEELWSLEDYISEEEYNEEEDCNSHCEKEEEEEEEEEEENESSNESDEESNDSDDSKEEKTKEETNI